MRGPRRSAPSGTRGSHTGGPKGTLAAAAQAEIERRRAAPRTVHRVPLDPDRPDDWGTD